MEIARLAILLASAFGAGAVNSIAGGGTLISFPALVGVGLPPVVANATNTVAMLPGTLGSVWAYRRELRQNRRLAWRFLLPSVVGGAIGAAIVIGTSERAFELIVPWLVLMATLLILFKNRLRARWSEPRRHGGARHRWATLAILAMAIYGGYFGAGIGIITLAVLSFVSDLGIHEMNAVKTLLGSAVNGTAAAVFLVRGAAHLPTVGVMTIGMVAGGYLGARLARRTPTKLVEGAVVFIGFTMTLVLAWRWLS